MRIEIARSARLIVLIAAITAIIVAVWRLEAETAGLDIADSNAGTIPVSIFRASSKPPGPLVVIAHGFAGSRQLMLPFAVTLARNGYTAVTFDFPGHGRNPLPMTGGLSDPGASEWTLLDALEAVVTFARTQTSQDQGLAVLGHSMAADIVIRFAVAHPDVRATVGLSAFSPVVTATAPRNLLVIDGALESAMLIDAARRVVGMASGDIAPLERVTYGSFAEGTARRLVLAPGVEHIGVLYSAQSLIETLGWMNQAFGRAGDAGIDHRPPALGLLFAGLIALAWPLARLLPRVVPDATLFEAKSPRLGFGRFMAVAVPPALITPLVLSRLPTDFLPILLGDYLAAHFALYGGLTLAGAWLAGLRPGFRSLGRPLVIVAVAMLIYDLGAIGWPLDRYLMNFVPAPGRSPLVLAVLLGTLPYFVADAWLTAGRPVRTVVTRLLLLLSLALAVGLDPGRLFFLIIIVPVILIFLTVYGVTSAVASRACGTPFPAAIAQAAAIAWAVAVTFPLVR